MTREEVKRRLLNIEHRTPIHTRKDARDFEALEMAIEALSQEPCDNAISRDELLKAIDTWDKFGYTETGCFVREPKGDYVPYIHYDDVIKSIKGMPSVTQKSGEWIPVSERLPEAFRFVNCTCHSLIDDRKDWVVETCYIPQPPDSPYSDWGNIPMLNMGDCEVVAWMYRDIPKPYKVEPQESEEQE